MVDVVMNSIPPTQMTSWTNAFRPDTKKDSPFDEPCVFS